MKSDTVLGYLVHRFAGQQENLATEALSFILRTSPAASLAFTKFVCQIGFDCPEHLLFETQQGGPIQGIRDMECHDASDQLRVVVENKFWAPLTDHQPVTYLRRLCPGVPGALLFVVPEARRPMVWNEVLNRCKEAEFPVSDERQRGTVRAACVGAGHHTAITSWRSLLDALSSAASIADEIDRLNDISQLRGLCNMMDEEEILPLDADEITDQRMARRIINFHDLALAIVSEAARMHLCTRDEARSSRLQCGSGARIKIGKYFAWAGFDFLAWRRKGISPIWLGFTDRKQMPELREKLRHLRMSEPQRCFDSENGRSVIVPTLLSAGVEKYRIIEAALEQITELSCLLGGQETSVITPETILEIGTEGGVFKLFGKKDAAGTWSFCTKTDETTLIEVVDEGDIGDKRDLVQTSPPLRSFEEAVSLIKYRWYSWTPIQIHPEFREAILKEVQRRGTPEEVATWNSRLPARS